MALSLGIQLRDTGEDKDIIGQILSYPCVEFDPEPGSNHLDGIADRVFPEEERETLIREPYISPIFDPEMHRMPPTMILIGTCDFLLDDNLRFAGRLVKAGVDLDFRLYQGMVHGFIHMGTEPGDDMAYRIAEKMRKLYNIL